jgi:miniconductance mechanosensitive channel
MTFLVRQLSPTPEGLPLEIYVFANDTRWAHYEGIQADVFDHVLSVVSEFGLQVYQRPSGHDLGVLARSGNGDARRAEGASDERRRIAATAAEE